MRRKVIAIIYNAKRVVSLAEKHDSFKKFLDKHHSLSLSDGYRCLRRNSNL